MGLTSNSAPERPDGGSGSCSEFGMQSGIPFSGSHAVSREGEQRGRRTPPPSSPAASSRANKLGIFIKHQLFSSPR